MSTHRSISLTQEERSKLEQIVRSGNAPARTQTRVRILLLSDRSLGDKRTDKVVAEAVMCDPTTVRNIRRKYLDQGMDVAINDKGWPGREPIFTGEVEAQLTLLACSAPPEGRAHWTLRLLAGQMIELGYVETISYVTVGEILKKTRSSPGR